MNGLLKNWSQVSRCSEMPQTKSMGTPNSQDKQEEAYILAWTAELEPTHYTAHPPYHDYVSSPNKEDRRAECLFTK